MIEPQTEFPESTQARIDRFTRAIERYRAEGFAYVTLSPKGIAQPHRAGKLARLLYTIDRYPGAQLVELAAADAVQTIIHWALYVAPQKTGDANVRRPNPHKSPRFARSQLRCQRLNPMRR